MTRLKFVVSAAALTCLSVLPSNALAQSAIAGTVKDATGAVMPGVTVEAASPALIEKSKTVVTDGEGDYRIVDLRPGTYIITFTLPGFSTIKREGLELPSNFTATINAEMKVGALEESVTVSGASPVVDVQSNVEVAGAVARRARRGAEREDHSEPRPAHRRRDADARRTSAARARCSRPTSRSTASAPRARWSPSTA